jgi:hypothetical protein
MEKFKRQNNKSKSIRPTFLSKYSDATNKEIVAQDVSFND